METVFLKKGEDRRLRIGHLWVFSNEIDTRRSPLSSFTPGQSVLVADSGGRPLGTGYINPASLIAVRMVSRKADEALGPDLLRRRLSDALALRERMFPSPFYRLCHGEGDFLPGLIADRHGDHLVCQITTAGMDAHTDELIGTETETLQGDALTLLADLRREGRTFDIVCLDPPAFIKRKKDARQGLEAYQRVNELGLDLVRPGGMLMTCSCSHHLEADALRGMVTRAAGKRRRHARLLFQGFQGPDHPIHPAMPETAYLKTFLFHLPE